MRTRPAGSFESLARFASHRSLVLAAALALSAAPATAQDTDGDLVPDATDNCVDVPNPDQYDDDWDRFGNVCDGDLNNDGATDAGDRALLDAEVNAAEPVALADVDGSGVVDAADLTYFDTELAGLPPGPTGALAHDGDGDGVLDYCTPPAPHAAFPSEWDPLLQPDLLTNGQLASTLGDEPDGWDPMDPDYVAYRSDMATTGVYQVLPFGGAGGIGVGACSRTCVAPATIPVQYGRTYAFTFLLCTGPFPPPVPWITFDEYDAAPAAISAVDPLGVSKAMSSEPGRWEETSVFYTPSSPAVVSVRPRLTRKAGPDGGNGTFFSTDFAFWELAPSGERTYRRPPAPKRPFDGARVKVDALGNVSVLDLGTQQFEPFFPIGIYATWQREDFSFYADMGFNTVMNDRGVNLAAPRAIAAGMRFLVNTAGLWNAALYPPVDDVLNSLALTALDPMGQSVPVYDSLLGFHTDNENFSQCLQSGGSCAVPYTSPWNGWLAPQPGITNVGPIPDLYAFDRAQNGGERGVPNYFLNGNPNVARAYAVDTVNAEGDPRMDVTGSYGVSSFEQVQAAANQLGPGVFIQIQAHVARRFLPTAWGGVARGARGIATWRDQPVGPYFLRAPLLTLCGTTLPTLTPRLTLENPPGTVVEGDASEAQAEILDDEGESSDCPGSEIGRRYHVKLQPNGTAENDFMPGEALVDPITDTPLGDAYVLDVTGSSEVIHIGSLDQYAWSAELDGFRDDVEFLRPVLETDHRTSWSAECLATLADVPGNPSVSFGDQGIVCGGRSLGDKQYLIASNTFFEIDPFADFLEQHHGETLDVDVHFSNLPATAEQVRVFDSATNSFGAPSALAGDSLQLTLPPFGVAILEVPEPGMELGVGVGALGLLGLGWVRDRRVPSARRNPARGRDPRGSGATR